MKLNNLMSIGCTTLALAALFLIFAAPAPVRAAEDPAKYPSRAIRWVVPFPPGGGNDTIARMIPERIAKPLKQQVVVDNRPGASGLVAAERAS